MNGSDRTQLGSIIGYLRHTHKIPHDLIKKEYNIVFCDGKFGVFSRVTQDELHGMSVLQPDIIILARDRTRIRLVIEYDGPGHYRYPGRLKQTANRNRRYERAGIPYSVINIAELNAHHISVFEYIDTQMAGHT